MLNGNGIDLAALDIVAINPEAAVDILDIVFFRLAAITLPVIATSITSAIVFFFVAKVFIVVAIANIFSAVAAALVITTPTFLNPDNFSSSPAKSCICWPKSPTLPK